MGALIPAKLLEMGQSITTELMNQDTLPVITTQTANGQGHQSNDQIYQNLQRLLIKQDYNIFFMNLSHFPKKVFFSLILLVGMSNLALTFDNFQQRCVYYSDQDYCCNGGRDNIRFYFNLSDQYEIRKKTGWGFTSCEELDPRPNRTIYPASTWKYYERQGGPQEGYYVQFKQEAKKIFNKFGKLQRYVLNVTMAKNECKIEFLDYNCTIIGDGTIMHWGIDNPLFPPSEIHLQCERIWKVQEE